MRLIAAFLLLHFFLSTFTPGGVAELWQLHALPEHYAQHAAETPDVGVGAFLLMHYLDPAHEASDREAHGKLPFQHHGKVLVPGGLPERAQQWTAHVARTGTPCGTVHVAQCLVRARGSIDHPPQA